MHSSFFAVVGAASLILGGCGAEADRTLERAGSENIHGSEDIGVSTGELTGCSRTELANVVVTCFSAYTNCDFRLMENNFDCEEGVVGQASTETLFGDGDTFTTVATKLFDKLEEGTNGYGAVTIATQFGHAFASQHETWCYDGGLDKWMLGTWHMDPWSKRAVLDPGSDCQ